MLRSTHKLSWLLLAWLGCVTSCGDSGNTSPDMNGTNMNGVPLDVSLAGAVQKGPFVLGSTINVSPLDATLNPNGQVFNTKTNDDAGHFAVNFKASGLVSLEGSGFYYNEVSGGLSTSNLTLRALYEIKASGAQNAIINLVTHLTYDRVKNLVIGGATFDAATKQAESELRTALAIGNATFAPGKSGIQMDVLGGDSDANAYLFVVSSVIAQAGVTKALGTVSVDATIQELLNTTANDLANDGMVSPTLTALYKQAQLDLDSYDVVDKLAARLAAIGSNATIPNIDRVLDSDGDGFANAVDNCPWVANPAQNTITNQMCRVARFVGPALPYNGNNTLMASNLSGGATDSIVFVNVANSGPNAATGQIFPFNPTSGFGTPVPFTFPIPSGMTGAPSIDRVFYRDMNKDGALDVLLSGPNWMAVYPSNGAGGFGAPQTLTKNPPDTVAGTPYQGFSSVAAADFDGNGQTDLAGVSYNNSGLASKFLIQRQTAPGVWGVPTEVFPVTVPANNSQSQVFLGDFNKDGKPDVLLALFDGMLSTTATIALGNGAGGFAAMTPVSFTGMVSGSSVSDTDGDGNLDFVFYYNGGWSVLLGDGTGKLKAATTFSANATTLLAGPLTADKSPCYWNPNGIPFSYATVACRGNAYQSQVTRIKGFPIATPVFYDVNHDGINDLLTFTPGLTVFLVNK